MGSLHEYWPEIGGSPCSWNELCDGICRVDANQQHNLAHKQNQAEAQASTQIREFQPIVTIKELDAENRAIGLAREMYEAPGKKSTAAQIASEVRQKCDPGVGHRTAGHNFTINTQWVGRCKKQAQCEGNPWQQA